MSERTTIMDHFDFHARLTAEIASLTIVLGGFVSIIPTLGIILGCIWYALNIYDWFQKRREAARKLPRNVREMKEQDAANR